MTDLSSWTKSNCTASAPQTDPSSGRSYCRVTCSATTGSHFIMSPASGAISTNGSFDIKYRPGTDSGWIAILGSSSPDNQILWINPVTNESYGQKAAGGVTEVYEDGFYRIQGWMLNGGVIGNLIVYGNVAETAGELAVASTATGSEYFDIADPVIIDSTVDLGDEFKFQAVQQSVTAEGILRFKTTTPYSDSVSNMIATPGRLDILLPDTYNPANSYKVVICLGVEPTPGNSYPAEMPIIANADLHNTHDVIVVQWSNQNALYPWWGAKNTGTNDYEKVIINQLIPYLRARYSIEEGKSGIILLGWSKGGWGALSLILRNPTEVGHVGIWDADYNEVFGVSDSGGVFDYGETDFFGTEAQFLLHNPKTLLPTSLTALNDRKRLVVMGAARFNPDTVQLHDDLTLYEIEHEYFYVDANDVGTGGANHTSSFGWIAGDGTWASTYSGPSLFDSLMAVANFEEPVVEPVPNTDEWVAEVLVPMGPVIRNYYKQFKYIDKNGYPYYRRPEDVINGYSGKT